VHWLHDAMCAGQGDGEVRRTEHRDRMTSRDPPSSRHSIRHHWQRARQVVTTSDDGSAIALPAFASDVDNSGH
jgi:hypothetical protein